MITLIITVGTLLVLIMGYKRSASKKKSYHESDFNYRPTIGSINLSASKRYKYR